MDVIDLRIEYFIHLGYLTETSDKPYVLNASVLGLALKIFSSHSALDFPTVAPNLVKKIRNKKLSLFLTDQGEDYLFTRLQTLSAPLFAFMCPVFARVNHLTIQFGGTKSIYENIKGIGGEHMRRVFKEKGNKYLVLVDNKRPYDYLEHTYEFDLLVEAREFIKKLLTFLPPSRMELRKVRQRNNRISSEKMLLVTKTKTRTYRT